MDSRSNNIAESGTINCPSKVNPSLKRSAPIKIRGIPSSLRDYTKLMNRDKELRRRSEGLLELLKAFNKFQHLIPIDFLLANGQASVRNRRRKHLDDVFLSVIASGLARPPSGYGIIRSLFFSNGITLGI